MIPCVSSLTSMSWPLEFARFYLSHPGPIPKETGELAALESLDLHGNKLAGIHRAPPHMPNGSLTYSDLYGSLWYTFVDIPLLASHQGAIPASLGNLVELENLDLSHNQLSGMFWPRGDPYELHTGTDSSREPCCLLLWFDIIWRKARYQSRFLAWKTSKESTWITTRGFVVGFSSCPF